MAKMGPPKDNQNSLKHGGAAAERALSTGADLTGMAAVVEAAVTAELDRDGIEAIIKRDAVRLQTVSDLYYAAILSSGDMARLDVLVKRWGWLQASTLRAWLELRKFEQGNRDAIDIGELREKYGNGE